GLRSTTSILMVSTSTFIPLRPSVHVPPSSIPAVPSNNGSNNGGAGQAALSIIYPDLFAEVFLQANLWDKQKAILRAIATKPLVAVKACHSSGKTYLAAQALLWFLQRYEKSTVISTAPTWQQIEKLLWTEVHVALQNSRIKFPKPLKTELSFESLGYPKRLAYGLSTSVTNQDEGVKFQGIHNDHVLMILDEAPGVDPKIWNAIEG